MGNYVYDAKKETLFIDAVKMSDYGNDVKFGMDYLTDFAGHETGTDGDTQGYEMHDNTMVITLNILLASPLNALLTTLAFARARFPVIHASGNYQNGDVGGGCTKGYFLKPAAKEFGVIPGMRTWTIHCPNWNENFILG